MIWLSIYKLMLVRLNVPLIPAPSWRVSVYLSKKIRYVLFYVFSSKSADRRKNKCSKLFGKSGSNSFHSKRRELRAPFSNPFFNFLCIFFPFSHIYFRQFLRSCSDIFVGKVCSTDKQQKYLSALRGEWERECVKGLYCARSVYSGSSITKVRGFLSNTQSENKRSDEKGGEKDSRE